MTYSPSSPLLGRGTTSPEAIQAWFEARGRALAAQFGKNGQYTPVPADLGRIIVEEAARYPEAVINHDIAAGQIDEETAGWQSEFARERLNPGGIGAVDNNPGEAYRFPSLRAGIAAHMAHMLTYAAGLGPWNTVDPRFAHVPKANIGTVKTIGALAGRWATQPKYGEFVSTRANLLLDFANHGTWTPAMPVDISGFTPPQIVQQWFAPNGVSYLGEPMEMWGVCIHQTGNTSPTSEAQQNVNYMKSPEAINRQASWHATVGLGVVIETIPGDKQAFHASDGDGPGNTHFMAIEGVMCYPVGSAEFRRVMMNHAWYAAKKLHEKGLPITPVVQDADWSAGVTLAQHNSFARDNKDCPMFYRDNGLWPQFVEYTRAFYAEFDKPSKPATDPNARMVEHPDYGTHWIINLDTPDGRVEMFKTWKDAGEIAGWGYPLGGMERHLVNGVPVYRQPYENGIGEFYPKGWDGNAKRGFGRLGGIPQNFDWYRQFIERRAA